MKNKIKIDPFLQKVQSIILEIRSWPEYIDPSEDDERFDVITTDDNIIPFEEWYESRKDDFLFSKEKMLESYNRLIELADNSK